MVVICCFDTFEEYVIVISRFQKSIDLIHFSQCSNFLNLNFLILKTIRIGSNWDKRSKSVHVLLPLFYILYIILFDDIVLQGNIVFLHL